MVVALIFAQLSTTAVAATDSVYASPSVRVTVTAAAAENQRLSRVVQSYRAHVESEVAIIVQDSIDRELFGMTQQHASTAEWRRGRFDVRVTSLRPAFRMSEAPGWPGPAWLIPALHGDRIPFVFVRYIARSDRRSGEHPARSDTVPVEHPLGPDRERRYRFSGGETVATIQASARRIPIVRIHVTPRYSPDEDGAAFEGDIYLDATRNQIVRMRGRFVRFLPSSSRGEKFLRVTGSTIAPYIDVTCEEVGGQVWLPHTERVESQLETALLFNQRQILRLTATFRDHVVDSSAFATPAPGDPYTHVSYAPNDSLWLAHDWPAPLGSAIRSAQSRDFDDVAPPNWRDVGPPQLSARPSRLGRVVHVDPIEGWFTGAEATLSFRDRAPGLSLRAFGGWAWTEQTARGGGAVVWRHDGRVAALHAQRALETTNDFLPPMSVDDPAFAELLGFAERRDYVDRRIVAVSLSDIRHSVPGAIMSAQIGVGRDESERTRMTRPPFSRRRDPVPANRAAVDGDYARLALGFELHPNVSLANVPGAGAQLHYEAAAGQLDWQRATVAITHRNAWGALHFGERLDAGIVESRHQLPPQQLLEVGGTARLSGYSYKQFAGDRAALASAGANYLLPILRGAHFRGALRRLPAVNPGIGAGVELGWSVLSSEAARASVLALSDPSDSSPLSVATHGIRGSGGFALTLFSGLVHLGFAHSLDAGTQWKWTVGLGAIY